VFVPIISISIHVPDDEVGCRIGAFVSYDGDECVTKPVLALLGYGVYEGLFGIFDEDSVEPLTDYRDIVAFYRKTGKPPMPRLRLDSGECVWGSFCYWDLEEEVQKIAAGATVRQVSPEDFVEEVREGLVQYEEWKETEEYINTWGLTSKPTTEVN